MALSGTVRREWAAYRREVPTSRVRTLTAILAAMAVAASACTSVAEPTTTTISAGTTTSATLPDPCPEVFCVVFELDPDAEWSDGTPVTVADFVHTHQQAVELGIRGHDRVTLIEPVDDRTLLVGFGGVYSAFRGLFEVVLPAHSTDAYSGRYTFHSAEGGVELRSRHPGVAVEEVRLVPVEGVRGVVQGFRRGEIDLAWLAEPPSWAVMELAEIEDVSVEVAPGPDWEMVTFNQADPLLAEAFVRQALAHGLDREAILDATVRTVDSGARPLDSTMWLHGSGYQVPAYPYGHDTGAARALLEDNGCVPGEDGVFVCPGGRLSFVWATTAGDVWRETALQLATASLAEAGIEITPSLLVPGELFDDLHLFGDAWDIIGFAWTGQPDPGTAEDLYRCVGDGPHGFGRLNMGRHCGERVDALLEDASATIDGAARHALLQEVDRDFVDSAAIVPLYQRPVAIARDRSVVGVAVGPYTGVFDGLEAWAGPLSLVVGVVDLPADPGTSAPLDPFSHSIRRLVYRGAFRPGPDGGYAPDLVATFETIGG